MRLLGLVLVVVVIGCTSGAKPEHAPEELTKYVWFEKAPPRGKDFVHLLFVAKDFPIGAFIRTSSFVSHSERFDVLRDGRKLSLRFPQTEKKAELTFSVRGCDAPEPFADVCLELSANPWGGPKRYYGIELREAAERWPEVARVIGR